MEGRATNERMDFDGVVRCGSASTKSLIPDREHAGGGFVKPCGLGLFGLASLLIDLVENSGGELQAIDGVVNGGVVRKSVGHRPQNGFHVHARVIAGSGPCVTEKAAAENPSYRFGLKIEESNRKSWLWNPLSIMNEQVSNRQPKILKPNHHRITEMSAKKIANPASSRVAFALGLLNRNR